MKKIEKVIYTAAVVLDNVDFINVRHAKRYCHHITVQYGGMGATIPPYVGKEVYFFPAAIHWNDKGECLSGYLADPELMYHIAGIGHLTLSCADGTPPVYSNALIGDQAAHHGFAYHLHSIRCKVKAFVAYDDGTTGWEEEPL